MSSVEYADDGVRIYDSDGNLVGHLGHFESVPETVYSENTQADFQNGTLTDVVATTDGDLELAKEEGPVYNHIETSTADFNGTHAGTEAVDNAVKLLYEHNGYDAYVKSLLHFNGADASTTFTDETGRTWTANGNAQIDTAQSKFGGSSGYFGGAGDYIDTPDSEDFNVGAGDFAIDFFLRPEAIGASQYICGQCSSTLLAENISIWGELLNTGPIRFQFRGSGSITYAIVISSSSMDTTKFRHVEFDRSGNTGYLFIDGILEATVNMTGLTINNSTYKFAIGRLGEHYYVPYKGWMDEFRFCKGIARHTANFTPPAAPYSADGYRASGNYVTKELDINGAGAAGAATLTFNKTTTANTTLTVDYRTFVNGSWGSWVQGVASGVTIIPAGTELTGYKAQIRVNEATADTAVTPALNDLTVHVEAEDFCHIETVTADVDGTHTDTVARDDSVKLKNLYAVSWDVQYDGSVLPASASPAWTRDAYGSPTEEIVSGALHLNSSHWMQYYRSGVVTASNITIVEARVRIVSGSDYRIAIAEGSAAKGINISLTATSIIVQSGGPTIPCDLTSYKTIRLVKIGQSAWEIYVDSNLVALGALPVTGISNGIWFGNYSGGETYTDYVYYDLNASNNYASSGNYVTQELDLNNMVKAGAATLTFNKTTLANTTLTMDYRIYDGAWGNWILNVASGVTIIPSGTALAGYRVQVRANLATTDATVTPSLDDLVISIISARKPTGERESLSFAIDNVCTASWFATLNGQTLTMQSNLSRNGGSTWEGWQNCTSGETVPGTDSGDLSNARLKIREILSTADVTVTPQLHKVTVGLKRYDYGQMIKNGMIILFDPLAGQGLEIWDMGIRKVLIGRLDDGTIGVEFRSAGLGDRCGYIEAANDIYGQNLKIVGANDANASQNVVIDGASVYILTDTQVWIEGSAHVNGDFTATNKLCTEETSRGTVGMFTRESPEQKYLDTGRAELVKGECRIDIDPTFLECIEPDSESTPWLIHLTPRGPFTPYEAEIGDSYFIVKSKEEVDGKFTWSFEATRKNRAGVRFPDMKSLVSKKEAGPVDPAPPEKS
jgi:hypothetical protein